MEITKEKLKEYFDKHNVECDIDTHHGVGHVDDNFDDVFEAVKDLIESIK